MKMNKDIAIIGMSGRFPDAKNISELYNNLKEGKDSIKDISPQRIKDTNLPSDKQYLKCGYLEDIDKFDYGLFNLSLGEAENMGPAQRLLLEVAYEVFENSGYGIDYFNGSNTSVFTVEKDSNYYQPAEQFTPVVITGNFPPYLAARIARQFNLHGNTAVVDTTCSSALVALHLACNELLLGDCDYAFVGGVNINLFPIPESPHNMVLNNLGLLSVDGKSRAFSDDANGMSCGEVAAGVLLKPLKKAIRDDDIIHAVIKSIAVNNNAKRSASITAPDSIMQAELIKKAWSKAGINPELLSYIEVHGSGVKLSDSLEVEGLNLAFRKYTNKKMICPISTIKSNIGHNKNASGMPAIIKTIVSLKYGVIFPTVHYNKPNRMIDFNNSAVYINENFVEIKSKKRKIKYAGVTSLGTSGTNCHVVLASPPVRKLMQAPKLLNIDNGYYIITVSSRTPEGLKKNINVLRKEINKEKEYNLGDISYTLNCGRKHYPYRFACVVNSLEIFKRELNRAIKFIAKNYILHQDLKKLIFIFSDQTGIFTDEIDYFASNYFIFNKYYKKCKKLSPNTDNKYFRGFAFQYSYYKLLESNGIVTDNILAIGAGNILYDVIVGNMTLQEGIKAVFQYKEKKYKNIEEKVSKLINLETGKDPVAFIGIGLVDDFLNKLSEFNKGDGTYYVFYALERIKKEKPFCPFLKLIKSLYLNNYQIDWNCLYKHSAGRKAELPGYQFNKNKCEIKIPANIEKGSCEDIKSFEKRPHYTLTEKGNEIEERIAFYWRDALGIDKFFLKNDFFELGGDSLGVAGIINKINKEFNINLSFEDLYDYSTIEKLGKYIAKLWGTKQKIATVWKEVMKLEKVDFEDDFFKLGGHSLLATQVIKKIEEIFKIKLTFDEIYQYPVLSSLSDFMDTQISRFNADKRVVPGGVPLTEIEDWLLKNDIGSSKKTVKIKCPNIDFGLLLKTISELPRIYPDLKLNLLKKEKNGKWSKGSVNQGIFSEKFFIGNDFNNISDFKKEIQSLLNLEKKELCLAIIGQNKVSNIVFFRDSRTITRKLFIDLLKNFQYIYNLKLTGRKINKNNLNRDNKYLYTPKYSYAPYYGCRDSCILEKIRWENNGFFYNSLLPAKSFACLPNYYILNNKIKWCSIYNSDLLGYNNALDSLDIKFRYLKFTGKNEAEKYYKQSIKKNNILILIGSSYDLPFSRYYRNKEFVTAGIERRNFYRINISLFSGSLKDGPVIYSPNFNYFGEISQNDFWVYWSRENTIKKKNFNKYIENVFLETLEPFQVLDIQDVGRIKPHSTGMLYEALSQNVNEFYNDKIIKKDNSRGFSAAYFGRQVIQIFKKDVLENLNADRKSSADILLLDLTKRLQGSYLFLHDLLFDINFNDKNFNPELNGVLRIIEEWDSIYSKLLSVASRNRINYMSKISILPSFDLHEHKFLSKKDKQELIEVLNKVALSQDKIFDSLRDKLKTLFNY